MMCRFLRKRKKPDLKIDGFSWDFAQSLKEASAYGEGSLLSNPQGRASAITAQVNFIRANIRENDRVLEIGTNCGHFAYLASLLGAASIVTIELRAECAPAIEMLLAKDLGITSIIGDSAQVLPKLSGPFDIAWVDGDHSMQSALTDMQNCCGKTRLILVDDYDICSVREAVTAFIKDSDYELDSISNSKREIAKLIHRGEQAIL